MVAAGKATTGCEHKKKKVVKNEEGMKEVFKETVTRNKMGAAVMVAAVVAK